MLPTAQKLLDELLGQSTQINALCGAPDPTAGASIQEDARWCLDEPRLHENIRKILVKFCIPAPQVLSDVNYLSSTAPPAASEWHCMIGALVGRRPEGLWNLLDMVREMSRRHDHNAVRLLHILTQQALSCEQVLLWWYGTKLSQSLVGPQLFVSSKSSFGNTASAQYSCSLLCDEIVTLWRLAALNPGLSPGERSDLRNHLKQYHLQVVERVSKTLESGEGNASRLINRLPIEHCRFNLETFPGFKSAIESCFMTWDDYHLPGITYQAPIIAQCQCQVRVGDSIFSPSDASLISPLSQGALSPSLPVLRDKQYRTFSQLKKANSGNAAASASAADDRLSQDDSANSSSDESGQDSAGPPSSGETLINAEFEFERRRENCMREFCA